MSRNRLEDPSMITIYWIDIFMFLINVHWFVINEEFFEAQVKI